MFANQSNAVGGGTVITLDGALSQRDRKLLIDAIQDEFRKIVGLLDMLKAAIDSIKSTTNPTPIQLLSMSKELETSNEINNELGKYIEIQKKVFEVDDEFKTILQEADKC